MAGVAVRHHGRIIIAGAAARAAAHGAAPRVALALGVALALEASLPAGPAHAQQAAVAFGRADALAAVQRQPRAYHGSVGRRSLHVGLGLPGPDGRFEGVAVLLDQADHVVASGPVHGDADGPSCRLRLEFGDTTARLDGDCRPGVLSGTLDEVRRHPFDLVRFLRARGEEHILGEVWLTAGA